MNLDCLFFIICSLSFSIWPVTKSNSHICITRCRLCLNSIECNYFLFFNILPFRTIFCILNLFSIISEFLNWVSFLDFRPWILRIPWTHTNYICWHISIYLLDYIWRVYFCTICRYINRIIFSLILISNPYLNCCCLWCSIIYFNFLFSIFSTSIIGSRTNSYFTLFKCFNITVLIYCCNICIWTCPCNTCICCTIRFYSCIQLNSFFW